MIVYVYDPLPPLPDTGINPVVSVISSNSVNVAVALVNVGLTTAVNNPTFAGITIVKDASPDCTPAAPAPASENVILKSYVPVLLADKLDIVAVSFTEL